MMRLAVLLAALALACGCSEDPSLTPAVPQSDARWGTLEVGGKTIRVELAYTNRTRQQGLKHRTGLGEDEGMLFIFPIAEPQRFWMQDTLIGLDIMFLDNDGVILNIEHGKAGVEQPGYLSRGPARFVLEMIEGWAAAHGVEAGARIEISQELRDLALDEVNRPR